MRMSFTYTHKHAHIPDEAIDPNCYPTLVQDRASDSVSSRYKFISTMQVLRVLMDHGFEPTAAKEARVRRGSPGWQRHAVRLTNHAINREAAGGTTIPQILLENDHSGAGAFVFRIAFFEMVCSNGLVAKGYDEMKPLRVLHKGYADALVEAAVAAILQRLPRTLEDVATFKRTVLSEAERLAFAEEAVGLRFDSAKYSVSPHDVLCVRHHEQSYPTAWHVLNIVQENLIRGGIPVRHASSGLRRSARRIGGIRADVALNEALWGLMQRFAGLLKR